MRGANSNTTKHDTPHHIDLPGVWSAFRVSQQQARLLRYMPKGATPKERQARNPRECGLQP
ncbi:hypothetical protein MACH18_36560 [Phaeobacter italicus]|nr:hypothetical protein MACH18_36560 [Phaeobacter italicus]